MVLKVTGTTTSCKECCFRRYYSGGVYECIKADTQLPHGKENTIPSWCPLPNWPIQKEID